MHLTRPVLALVTAWLLLGGCGDYRAIVVVDKTLTAPSQEEGRIAEAAVALPKELSFLYDIGLSGFASGGAIDLAILREYCRPWKLAAVTEAPIPGMGMLTGEMYTPRSIGVRCEDPNAAQPR